MLESKRALLDFLKEHLPESDLDCYPEALFQQFVDHAIFLRKSVPWCEALEAEIFEHYVLFPRVNDEDLSFHRRLFFDALWPRIQNLPTMEARILEVNRWCHEMASYQAQDDRTASPLTVYRSGSGRCGEESAFLVSALRSVGIPARQVYAPRWAHCDDNHAWVEALCQGRWRFLGACEPEPVLDRGWFNAAASRAVLVHSRLFGPGRSPLHGTLLSRDGAVCWYNQTRRYAPTAVYTLRALCAGAPAAGAVFRIQLLNEAGFHTVAVLTADEAGQAQVELGKGDIHVLAAWNGLWAEGDRGPEGGALTLRLGPLPAEDGGWTEFDVRAPQGAPVNPAPLDDQQRSVRAAVLREGTGLREARKAAFYRPAREAAWEPLLQAARGNCPTIAAFLEKDGDPRREMLLRSLSSKDLRDVTAQVLEDHLANTPAAELPEEIYASYVLCPRIELEPLTPWRGTLRQALPKGVEPLELWRMLNRRIRTDVTQVYGNLVWTPLAAWQYRRCDRRSLGILYVACLRALGIPGRLRPLDGTPEYWQGGTFHPVTPEGMGTLLLENSAPLLYRQNWTLSRWGSGGWRILTLPERTESAVLPAGRYRIVTSVRLPNGNQFAAMRSFPIQPGQTRRLRPPLRPYALEDMLFCQALPAIPAQTPEGGDVPDLCRMGKNLLCWIEPGREPTEHLLSELAAGQRDMGAALLLPSRESMNHPTLAKVLSRCPKTCVLLGDWAYDQEHIARQLGCDPSDPPLSVVCDGHGQAVYAASGYRVGSAALLAQIASRYDSPSPEDIRNDIICG